MFQGCSLATEFKEIQIYGLFEMRLLQRKNQGAWIKSLGLFDIFCGDGQNQLEGKLISGSPIEILRAIKTTEIYKYIKTAFFPSDIRLGAIKGLSTLMGDIHQIDVRLQVRNAETQIGLIEKYLSKSRMNHAIILIDPNGPKIMPIEKIKRLGKFHKQVDLIINISETAINRLKACSVTKDKNWWANYDNFAEILWDIKKQYRWGFLRDTLPSDPQRWRIFTAWSSMRPRNGWEKQGFYKIESKQDIINILNGEFNGSYNTSAFPLFPRDDAGRIQSLEAGHRGSRCS